MNLKDSLWHVSNKLTRLLVPKMELVLRLGLHDFCSLARFIEMADVFKLFKTHIDLTEKKLHVFIFGSCLATFKLGKAGS